MQAQPQRHPEPVDRVVPAPAGPDTGSPRLQLRIAPEQPPGSMPGWRYNYYQLLRLIEQTLPNGQRLGLDTLPSQEPLRVLPDAKLRFPTAEISYFGLPMPRGEEPALWHPPWREMRVSFGGLYGVLVVAGVYGAGQLVESLYLTPRLVGERIGLHPLAVIFALLAFGQLFGFLGVLIALPASAVLLVAIRRMRASYMLSKLYQG